MGSAASTLPQSTATLWLQPGTNPDGSPLYAASSTGAAGEVPVQVPITDAVCLDDLDENGNETTSDAQALAQDVYHILLEVLGSNPDDQNRGIGAMSYASGTSDALTPLPSIVDSQLRKDTRIDSSRSTLAVDNSTSPPSWTLSVRIVASGEVIPLSYFFSQATGLVPQ